MPRSFHASLLLVLPWQQVRGAGHASCECITSFPSLWAQNWVVNSTCQLVKGGSYTGVAGEADLCYAVNYGLGSCQDWDNNQPPLCHGNDKPPWCSQKWCYVNSTSCDLGDSVISARQTPGVRDVDTPHYSYLTCGFESAYAKYHRAALKSATEIITTVEGYLVDMRNYVERIVNDLNADESSGTCNNFVDGCACKNCVAGAGTWRSPNGLSGYDVDFNAVSVTHTDGAARSVKNSREHRAQCLALLLQGKLQQIARLEYNDPSRMGFIAFGDQGSAIYACWPGITFCPKAQNPYDPRFRPWYVSAVSGPKDVVIIMDRSGSMREQNRWVHAQEAAKRVLGTLSEYDRANIVMFSTDAQTFSSTSVLQVVTQDKREEMSQWIDAMQPVGNTNFRRGFEQAFHLLWQSHTGSGHSTNCNQVVLFLTDGVDTSSLALEEVDKLQEDLVRRGGRRAAIFTYSFGSNADKERTKAIACRNSGIWYHVSSSQDIASVMSGYYMYYAGPLALTKQTRWTRYTEWTTKNELITGTLAVFDRTTEPTQLIGVVAFDVSIIMAVSTFSKKPDFLGAMAKIDQEASACTVVNHSYPILEALRKGVAPESSCAPGIKVATANPAQRRVHVLARPWALLLLLRLVAFVTG